MSATILNEEMPPSADPLSEDATLVLAAGPLAGAMVPSSGRISVGGKSPLTMGIKEANGGGPAAQKLDRLGIRAVVVEGAPKHQGLYVLKISAQGITLKAVDAYKGMKTYELASKLIDENGNKPAVIAIGPAVFYFALVTVAIHGLVIFGLGRIAKLDLATLAVASQANVGGAASAIALASDTSCRSPEDNLIPRSRTSVSRRSGSERSHSSIPRTRATSQISSSVMSGRA